ncbi:MAG: hypothetical protein HY721_33375, partial [Planctomycetes bacterium]|nr:hypothetical protein [Planctomycetota bacterium]
DGAIDEEDVERLKGVFGRVIVHVGSQYAAQVSPGGSVARIGEGLAVVSSLEGHTAGVLHPGPTASVVRFEVTEDRGTAVWEGPEFSFVFPFGENAENPSWIEVDLHSGRVLGGNLTVRLTIDLFDHRVVEVAAPIQDGFVVLRPHGFELYHLTGIRGTLPEDFPLFGGQAFLLGKCDIPKAVSGHCCTVDYGVREEAGEMWAYIELSSGTELIAAPFDPADTEDYSRVRLFGLTTAQMAAREGMDNSEYIGLLRSDPVSRASKLWETGFPKFRGTAGQDAILNRLSQHLTFFVGKAQQFLAPPWVGDGCTGVPDFNFEDCCDAHDACYCRGGTEFDRLDCDLALYACIATTPPPWSAPLRNIKLAGVYFSGVRAFGSGHFNY